MGSVKSLNPDFTVTSLPSLHNGPTSYEVGAFPGVSGRRRQACHAPASGGYDGQHCLARPTLASNIHRFAEALLKLFLFRLVEPAVFEREEVQFAETRRFGQQSGALGAKPILLEIEAGEARQMG